MTKLPAWSHIGALAIVLLSGAFQSANSAPINPTFTTFGELAIADFGGTGINDDYVAITTFVSGSDTITLGLTAIQRFANPSPVNNGAGIFTVTRGANFGDPTFLTMPSSTLGATWSLGYYMNIAGGGAFDDYSFELLYDLNPSYNTDQSAHGKLDFNAAIVAQFGPILPFVTTVDQNQNMLFSFLQPPPSLPFVTPPATSFNPFAPWAEYSFALIVRNGLGAEIARAAIEVIVIPEPGTLTLLALCCGPWLLARRRRRRHVEIT